MILQDEIEVVNSTTFEITSTNHGGALVCQSGSSMGVAWYFADSSMVPGAPAAVFQQTKESTHTSYSVLSRGINSTAQLNHTNGVWMCRVNGSTEGEITVGIYTREERYKIHPWYADT